MDRTRVVAEARGEAARVAAVTGKKRVRRSPEEARALILEAAQELLADKGPDALRLTEVARRAGVSHGLVTHYFGTVEQLTEAALEAHVRALRADFLDRFAEDGGGPEAWVEHLFGSLAHPLYGRLLLWALLSGRVDSQDFFPHRERGLVQVADALEAWVAAHPIAPDPQKASDRATPGRAASDPAVGEGRTIDRDQIEQRLVLALSVGFGYLLARKVLWASLGREATEERDRAFRRQLSALLLAPPE